MAEHDTNAVIIVRNEPRARNVLAGAGMLGLLVASLVLWGPVWIIDAANWILEVVVQPAANWIREFFEQEPHPTEAPVPPPP